MGANVRFREKSGHDTGARTMSKLYAGFLVIVSLFAMAALGMLVLMLIMEVSHLVAPSYSPGMGR